MKIQVLTNSQTSSAAIWFNSLSKTQKEELASLDLTSPSDPIQRDVCMDWIEEHGGERPFWGYLYTTEVGQFE